MSNKLENDQVEFEGCIAVAESASKLALAIVINGRREWVPCSVIHDDSEVYKVGDRGTLVIPAWFAMEKKLI